MFMFIHWWRWLPCEVPTCNSGFSSGSCSKTLRYGPEPQVMRYKKVIKLLLCVDRDRNRKHKLCETLSRSGLETRSAASRTFVCVRRVLAPCLTVLWAFCLQRFLDGGTSVSTTAVRSRTLTWPSLWWWGGGRSTTDSTSSSPASSSPPSHSSSSCCRPTLERRSHWVRTRCMKLYWHRVALTMTTAWCRPCSSCRPCRVSQMCSHWSEGLKLFFPKIEKLFFTSCWN